MLIETQLDIWCMWIFVDRKTWLELFYELNADKIYEWDYNIISPFLLRLLQPYEAKITKLDIKQNRCLLKGWSFQNQYFNHIDLLLSFPQIVKCGYILIKSTNNTWLVTQTRKCSSDLHHEVRHVVRPIEQKHQVIGDLTSIWGRFRTIGCDKTLRWVLYTASCSPCTLHSCGQELAH